MIRKLIRARTKAVKIAWQTANMRWFTMGKGMTTLTRAKFEDSDAHYLLIEPIPYDQHPKKDTMNSWTDLHPHTVFLKFETSDDVVRIIRILIEMRDTMKIEEGRLGEPPRDT